MTLEVIAPDGYIYTVKGKTLEEALAVAFPAKKPQPVTAPVSLDVFN